MSQASGLVLIVDDDEELCELLEYSCKQKGLRVHVASTTLQAREWLKDNSPDVMLLDIMMPGGNGLDLCFWLREQERFRKTPIILNSAIKDHETAQDALELGAVDFVRKPYNMEELQARIVGYCEKGNNR
jgi:DNA-binding response OmpR family regulator